MKSVFSNRHLRVNIILIVLTVLVVVTVTTLSTSALLRRDREATTRLVFDVIQRTMDEEFVKPLEVTTAMEHDSFLRDFLSREEDMPSDAFSAGMGRYLSDISSAEEWSGAYFTSAKTLNYYDSNGFAKVIDPIADPYDLWYTRFIGSGVDYDIDVEYDQMNSDVWTVFLDKRMEDENDNLLGVCTVAMEMDSIQKTIEDMEANYDVRVYFADKDGWVKVASSADLTQTNYIPEDDSATYSSGNSYVMAQYIPRLEWYLIVENTHDILYDIVRNMAILIFSVVFILLLAIVLINLKMTMNEQSLLTSKAETDALTKILNRDGLERRIKAFMGNLANNASGGAFFMIDLDHLKDVNDTLGHDSGDDALVQTAEILKKSFRSGDIIGRLGGDEFVVFSPGFVDHDLIRKKAEQLVRTGDHDIERESQSVRVSLSVGVAVYPEHSNNYADLFRKADKALYAAKDGGRNAYRIFGNY